MQNRHATWLRSIVLAASIVTVTRALAGGVDELPKDVQDSLYNPEMMDPSQPLGESAYRDWKAKNPPPWTIGYASSYAGNTWRADVMKRLQEEIIPKWKKLGLLKEVIITQSNLNDRRRFNRCGNLSIRASTQSSSVAPILHRSIRRSNMHPARCSGVLGSWLSYFPLCGEYLG